MTQGSSEGIREEFEKALQKALHEDWVIYGPIEESSEMDIALWAAQWMANKIADDALSVFNDPSAKAYIKHLVKELESK
jgi:tetrahydromethanopterin S-methyltransferase subunit H